MPRAELRDLIYFDFNKASSLFSQFEGGLIREITKEHQKYSGQNRISKYNFQFFKPEFGKTSSQKTSELESRVLHHDLLVRIEKLLSERGMVFDINNECNKEDSIKEIHNKIGEIPYIRAEGWVSIEDFGRIKNIFSNFNDIAAFISRCVLSSLEQTEDYQDILKSIEQLKQQAKEAKGSSRALINLKIKEMENQLKEIAVTAIGQTKVEDWLIEGTNLFIDTFLPGRLIYRFYPFEDKPGFNILANLKRECFVDNDLEHVVFAYGTRPNIKLTIFGLITSFPKLTGDPFEPMQELNINQDDEKFEKGLRGLFEAALEFEKFVRFSRYPNITVQPLAVYRAIRGNSEFIDNNNSKPWWKFWS